MNLSDKGMSITKSLEKQVRESIACSVLSIGSRVLSYAFFSFLLLYKISDFLNFTDGDLKM